MDRALGGPFRSERFSKDERFSLIKTTHSQLEVFRPCVYIFQVLVEGRVQVVNDFLLTALVVTEHIKSD